MLSRPVYEGRLISVVRRGAGCGGRTGVGDATRTPDRRSKPRRPDAHRRASRGPADGGVRHCRKCPAPRGPERWRGALSNGRCLKGQSIGGKAEQTSNIARGTPENLADLRLSDFRQASMSRGVEVRGSLEGPAFRAPSFLFIEARSFQETAYPAPVKNAGSEALAVRSSS